MRQRSKPLVVIIVLVFAVAALAAVARSMTQQPADASRASRLLTAHSYLYTPYEVGAMLGSGIDRVVAAGRHDVPLPMTLDQFAHAQTCGADSVVLGHPVSFASALTAQGHFIFTDYDVVVDDVIKNDPVFSVATTDHIVVTRPGGNIDLNGTHLQALDDSYPPLRVGGSYLLFLHHLVETNSYQTLGPAGTLTIEGSRARNPTAVKLSIEDDIDGNQFILALQRAMAVSCR
jgi:hypothetical protein